MKNDVSDGIVLHVAHAVDEIGTNLEDMGNFDETRRNLEDLLAKLGQDGQVSFDGSGRPFYQEGTRIDILEQIVS